MLILRILSRLFWFIILTLLLTVAIVYIISIAALYVPVFILFGKKGVDCIEDSIEWIVSKLVEKPFDKVFNEE